MLEYMTAIMTCGLHLDQNLCSNFGSDQTAPISAAPIEDYS